MKLKTVTLSLLMALSLSALTVGTTPNVVTIEGENGGLVKEDGAAWHSTMLKEKVSVMFYVDPDEKDTNSHFSAALKEKNYNRANYRSIAIVNLAATWKPNFAIESVLKEKQVEFPDTIYVKDKKSVLVKEWGVADDASNILIFSKSGKLLFYKSGAMSKDDMTKAFSLIENNL
jgi:predicted transcriptional regulator